jgi:hypothetical protein
MSIKKDDLVESRNGRGRVISIIGDEVIFVEDGKDCSKKIIVENERDCWKPEISKRNFWNIY